MKLFSKISEKIKSDGVKVIKFSPNTDLYINSIDLKNGDISEKRIIGYSIHENLRMFKVSSLKNQFETFWVSEDHSLIVYNDSDKKYHRRSPLKIKKDDNLIQTINGKKHFISNSDFLIEYDSKHTTGYDFTVEDNYTFYLELFC